MKITGSNIVETKNDLQESNTLQIEHRGAYIEMNSTKEGIAFHINHDCELLSNGSGWMVSNGNIRDVV